MADETAAYPAQYEKEVILKDGSAVLLRPVKPDDTAAWLDFVARLSTHTRYLRFFHVPKDFPAEQAERFCQVDYKNTFAFVAEVTRDGTRRIVSIGRYYRLPKRTTAEVALVTDDAYQRRGIGGSIMTWLVKVARDNGIARFEADVMSDNTAVMDMFQSYGFHTTVVHDGGLSHISIPLTRTRLLARKEEDRERDISVRSVHSILHPRSVAIIGASRDPNSLGYLLLKCVVESGFTGVVYPVNPKAEAIMSIKAYPSVSALPGEVDLAVIAVPAPFVCGVAEECGHRGVKGLVVISDGFKELGPEGAARERELRGISLSHGMRLVGPNCMGVINTDPEVSLNATFSSVYPPPGNLAFLSQSGAMGLVILDYARSLNMGISTFVSVGNRADISSNDLLEYWEQDPRTQVILLYLESVGNPRRFSRIARRVSARKPILAVKGGRTPAGSRAASSHTGAMAASSQVTDALFREAGIIRLDAIEELFDVAALLSHQPLPAGRRLAIVTNGGGPGIIAADAGANLGLQLPEFSAKSAAAIRPGIKRDIQINNPLDLTAGAGADEFEHALRVIAADPDSDAALVIFIPPILVNPETMVGTIGRLAPLFKQKKKPLLACFMGQRGVQPGIGVPSYLFPESAVNALARAVEYVELRRKVAGRIPRLSGIKREKAAKLMERVLTRSTQRPLWLSAPEIAELLAAYGIRFATTAFADTPEAAAAVAREMGFPVAVKVASDTVTHKSDVGGVVLGLKTDIEVAAAFNQIKLRLAGTGREKEMLGVTVQRMVEGGVETIAGVAQDPSFGPLILFGLGGIYTELIKDVALKLQPLTDRDAHDLVHSIKMARLFEGYRGLPPSDTDSLEDLLLRLSAMVEDLPQISELDFNPVKVMPKGEGYWVVDARIMLR